MKKNRFLVTLGTLLLIILNSSAQRVLHPRTTARFYKILDPCDYDLEDRLVVLFAYNFCRSDKKTAHGKDVKRGQDVFNEAAQGSRYVHFVEANLAGSKICSLYNDFNFSDSWPNFLFFKNGELVSTGLSGVGHTWCFTAGDILQTIQDLWHCDIKEVRKERVEERRREQELAAISGVYASPWMWGGPFYRGYIGWTPWYGYNPYYISPFSGSIIGN